MRNGMADIKEPTSEQCNKRELLFTEDPCAYYAIWYPQMGGYVAKCVVRINTKNPEDCFEAWVWHDGTFPFSEDDKERVPAHLHHCDPGQFVRFGENVEKLMESAQGLCDDG